MSCRETTPTAEQEDRQSSYITTQQQMKPCTQKRCKNKTKSQGWSWHLYLKSLMWYNSDDSVA